MTNGSPETVGRYQVRRELGRGMMGVVYLAKDPDLGRDIALKVIQVPPGANEEERTSFEQRFFSEAQSAARLTHPGIVIVHDVGRDAASGDLFMALQLLPGQTLETLLKEKGRLEWAEALRITRRVAEALHHAHSEGVVHRDIKPANIMILPTGDPRIMDFGIAKIERERLTATGQFIGTPLYMSPEQAMARPVDGRSDIFSLGSVLYEMLTGVSPFFGESVTRILYLLMSAEPEPPSRLVPTIPFAVDNILRRCLAKDLERRYRDAESLVNDITAIIGPGTEPGRAAVPAGSGTEAADSPIAGLAPPGRERSLPEDWTSLETRALPMSPVRKRRRALRTVLNIVALLLVGAALWWLASPPPVARRIVQSTPEPEPSSAETVEPRPPLPRSTPSRSANQAALLVVNFEHSLKDGLLRVYVDDLKVVDERFGGRITKKIVGIEIRSGQLNALLEVTPGLRTVKVEVLWDDNLKRQQSQTFFSPGGRLRLKAKLGSMGGLRKDLSLEWN